jgi:hypothetical protein
MSNMTTVEAKAYVPSKDFALSKRFYQEFGFELAWSSEDLAYFRHGNSSFLLQNFYEKGARRQFHDAFARRGRGGLVGPRPGCDLAAWYGVFVEPPADRSWGIRDFVLVESCRPPTFELTLARRSAQGFR